MFNPFIFRPLCVPLVLLLHSAQGLSQQVTAPVGAEQWMLGGCSSTINNVFSANNNPAAATDLKHFQAGVYSETRFLETHLQTANLSLIKPFRKLTIGASINQFGYSAFNQQRIALSCAKQLSSIFSLGVQLNYIGTYIQDFGSAGNMALGIGLYSKPAKNIVLSFMVFNPTQSKFGPYTNEQIPTYARLGFGYILSDKIRLLTEAEQQLNQRLVLRGGMYYQIHPVVHLAIGTATNPAIYTFGTALKLSKFKVDVAASFHQVLGLTPHLSITMPVKP